MSQNMKDADTVLLAAGILLARGFSDISAGLEAVAQRIRATSEPPPVPEDPTVWKLWRGSEVEGRTYPEGYTEGMPVQVKFRDGSKRKVNIGSAYASADYWAYGVVDKLISGLDIIAYRPANQPGD